MPIGFDGKNGSFDSCVSHFMNKTNKHTGKNFTSEEAHKVCGSLQSSQEKEIDIKTLYANQKISFREDKGEFYTEGFVATTHKDREGDVLTENAIHKIVQQINNKFLPQAGAVSERHDWIKQQNSDLPLVGRAINAEVRKTEDGQLGAYVVTHHNKTHPDFEGIKYNIENGYYPGYSIEFERVKGAEKETPNGRLIDDLSLWGYGVANLRKIANPHAEITEKYNKEMFIELKEGKYTCSKCGETVPMPKKKSHVETCKEEKEATSENEPSGDEKEDKNYVNSYVEKDRGKHKEASIASQSEKIQDEVLSMETVAKETVEVSKEDYALLAKFKEQTLKEAKIKEFAPFVKEAIEAEMKERMKSSKPMFNIDPDGPEFKELKNYEEALVRMKELDEPLANTKEGAWQARLSKHEQLVDIQYREAAKLTNALINEGVPVLQNFKLKDPIPRVNSQLNEGKRYFEMEEHFNGRISMKETNLRMKALDNASNAGSKINTNLTHASWTYGSYYQSPVELNDIYQPVVVNQLNDLNTTWGTLRKEDYSGYSQIQFRARTKRNTTAGGYSEGTNYTYGTDFSGEVGYDRFQQPFCYYHALVALTGQKMRFGMAPGGMGDIWANEIKWSTEDLLKVLDEGIIGTGDGTSESVALGFEGLILGTSGTLYGKSLTTYATLRSHTKAESSANISLGELRLMIERVQTGTGTGASQVISMARVPDLVLFMHHTQERFVKGLIQDMQRLVPTSARVGFEGRVEIDGVPIVTDFRMNTDDVFLIDSAHTKIGINLPPTVEPLPVTADAQAAHIKIYFNMYSDAPGNNAWYSGFATS